MNGNDVHVCMLLATFNQKNGQLDSFFSYSGGGLQWFAVVCGGLWWFAYIVSGYIVLNSGGDLWWFAVMCGGLR